ncbi:MAG: response regulator transcription factor [Elusimicrobia bacterium]|nr:response regulator transcription factor [Elusimicrobiota bacterium]
MAKILVVEDEKSVQELVKYCLEADGYMVVTADDGKMAGSWIKEIKFDLAILDLCLPDGNGIEICASIKEDPKTRAMPVIILTGNSSNEARIKSNLEAKADLFLNKPISPDDLRNAVKTMLAAAEKKKLLLRNSIRTKLGE